MRQAFSSKIKGTLKGWGFTYAWRCTKDDRLGPLMYCIIGVVSLVWRKITAFTKCPWLSVKKLKFTQPRWIDYFNMLVHGYEELIFGVWCQNSSFPTKCNSFCTVGGGEDIHIHSDEIKTLFFRVGGKVMCLHCVVVRSRPPEATAGYVMLS